MSCFICIKADDYEFLNDLIDELENIKLRQQMSPARSKTPVEPHAAAGPSGTHGTKNTGKLNNDKMSLEFMGLKNTSKLNNDKNEFGTGMGLKIQIS